MKPGPSLRSLCQKSLLLLGMVEIWRWLIGFWIMRFPTPGLQKRPWKLFLTFNALKSFHWANSLARHFLMLLLTGSVIVRDQLRMESLQNLSSIEPLQALLRFYKINHLDVARFMNFCPVEKTNIYTSTPTPTAQKINWWFWVQVLSKRQCSGSRFCF